MDDKEDIAEESPPAIERGPADSSEAEADPVDGAVPPDDPEVVPEFVVPKPGLYLLRPRGLRPAPRPSRRHRGSLRNDCPPDRRRASDRPPLKPRLR